MATTKTLKPAKSNKSAKPSKPAKSKSAPANPFNAPAAATYLGELASWELPKDVAFTQTDLAAALTAAGLDPAAARALCPRNAFIRAVRKLAADKIIGNLEEYTDALTFQFTGERRVGDRLAYDFEAKVSLNLTTFAITATDPAVEAAVQAELATCLEVRKIRDVTRLILGLFDKQADAFPIKPAAGVYFIPQKHVAFVEKIEKFVLALGGVLRRFPIPEGTVQGTAAVAGAVGDYIHTVIDEASDALKDMRANPSDAALKRAWKAVNFANTKIDDHRQFIAAQAAILEDEVAYVAKLLRDEEEKKAAAEAAAKQAAQGSGLVVVTSSPAPSVIAIVP